MRLKWMLDSVCLEILLILTQEGGQFGPNVSQAQKSFWTHRMELVGDVGHVEYPFVSFGDSVSVGVR
jgi:hypothetical protein